MDASPLTASTASGTQLHRYTLDRLDASFNTKVPGSQTRYDAKACQVHSCGGPQQAFSHIPSGMSVMTYVLPGGFTHRVDVDRAA